MGASGSLLGWVLGAGPLGFDVNANANLNSKFESRSIEHLASSLVSAASAIDLKHAGEAAAQKIYLAAQAVSRARIMTDSRVDLGLRDAIIELDSLLKSNVPSALDSLGSTFKDVWADVGQDIKVTASVLANASPQITMNSPDLRAGIEVLASASHEWTVVVSTIANVALTLGTYFVCTCVLYILVTAAPGVLSKVFDVLLSPLSWILIFLLLLAALMLIVFYVMQRYRPAIVIAPKAHQTYKDDLCAVLRSRGIVSCFFPHPLPKPRTFFERVFCSMRPNVIVLLIEQVTLAPNGDRKSDYSLEHVSKNLDAQVLIRNSKNRVFLVTARPLRNSAPPARLCDLKIRELRQEILRVTLVGIPDARIHELWLKAACSAAIVELTCKADDHFVSMIDFADVSTASREFDELRRMLKQCYGTQFQIADREGAALLIRVSGADRLVNSLARIGWNS